MPISLKKNSFFQIQNLILREQNMLAEQISKKDDKKRKPFFLINDVENMQKYWQFSI